MSLTEFEWRVMRDELLRAIVGGGAINEVITAALDVAHREGYQRGWADRAQVVRERDGIES